ncbi:phosphatase PAP2 family protein [Caulobacter sp.]|uniref:phosphatase PAP2 family protein n=1 Tax=Caulobacter sp. TaxID=78 RepID=UPI0031D55D08
MAKLLTKGLAETFDHEAIGLGAVALMAGAAALFAEVADDQAEPDGRASDWRVLKALRRNGDPKDPVGPKWLQRAAEETTALGGLTVVGGATALASGGLWLAGRRREAAWVAATFVGGLALSEGLKRVYTRGRPPREYRVAAAESHSFPSGHALLSAVTYLTIGAVVARSLSDARLKVYALAAGVGAATATGVTRVYLGVHWANDVVGGWAGGLFWAASSWMATKAWTTTALGRPHRHPAAWRRSWPRLAGISRLRA